MVTKIITKEKNHLLLNKLRKLYDFGSEQIEKIELNEDQPSFNNQVLLIQTAFINQYTHGIIILCQQCLPESAMLLVRSAFESLLNINYILEDASDYRAKSFILHESKDKKKNARQIDCLYQQDPSLEKEKGFLPSQELKDLIVQVNKNITNFEKREGKTFDWNDNLLIRLQELDRTNDNKDWEFQYRTIYWHLSQFSHATSRSSINMEKFDSNTKSIQIELDSHEEGLEFPIIMATVVYIELMSILSKRFNIPSKDELDRISW